jgi:phage gp36-like protein
MADPLITDEQLEARLSSYVVNRLLDDNGDGAGDADVLLQLRKDASAKVRGHIGPVFDPDTLDENIVDEVVRITLDVAQAMAAQRHPEVMRVDGFELMKQAERDLKKIRIGESNLGTKEDPPGVGANNGGYVSSGNPNRTTPKKRFTDNWGDF